MKLHLTKRNGSFYPSGNLDHEAAQKIAEGESIYIKTIECRNPQLHRKYFALINLIWEQLPENMEDCFTNKEEFRYWLQMKAGYFRTVKAPGKGSDLFLPRSIAFESMDEYEFRELYESVCDIVRRFILPVSQPKLEKELNEIL